MKTKRQKTTANGHLSRNSNHHPSTGQAPDKPLLFSDFGRGHVELMRGALAPSTLKSYTSEIAKLARYAPTLRLDALDAVFMAKYEWHLRNKLANAGSSVRKTVKVLRGILAAADRQGLPTAGGLAGYSVHLAPGRREHLDRRELGRLMSLCFSGRLNPGDFQVLRAFLFACFTGFRFSELSALKRSDIRSQRAQTRQPKTGAPVSVPLCFAARKLLECGSGDGGRLFPLPSNARANRRLARIVSRLRIPKRITFHCARHTFATLSLNMGMPLSVVQSVLGHRSIRTTEVYAKLLDSTVAREMRRWDGPRMRL